MSEFTHDEARRLLAYMDQQERLARESEERAKRGLFSFLRDLGLGAIVTKLASWVWSAIRKYLVKF